MCAHTTLDAHEFEVLNAIHLKRLADDKTLVALTGRDEAALASVLAMAATREWVLSLAHGHMLLPAGTGAVRDYYDNCYMTLRGDPALEAWYAGFGVLNTRFIALLTTWQQQADKGAVSKVLLVVEQLTRELERLLLQLPRYAAYQRRFMATLDAIDDGDTDLLCNPRRDSAHNIWFEFHEDILSVLGKPRDTT